MKITKLHVVLLLLGVLSSTYAMAQIHPPAPFEDGIPLFFAGAIVLGIYKLRKK